MIAVLSPSKSMDMTPANRSAFTEPAFLDASERLVATCRRLSVKDLMALMEISRPLAELNRVRFQSWQRPFTTENSKQALFAFTGDVYDGLASPSFTRGDVSYAQNHVRILSGLYGMLRPLDLIQPYRLEMGRPLATRGAKSLYEFWRATVTDSLNRMRDDTVVNLASQEYFKAVDSRALDKTIISPQFKDEKNGTYKIISFFAKRARGAMARFIVKERIAKAADLVGFCSDGYRYSPELSEPWRPVFTRPQST